LKFWGVTASHLPPNALPRPGTIKSVLDHHMLPHIILPQSISLFRSPSHLSVKELTAAGLTSPLHRPRKTSVRFLRVSSLFFSDRGELLCRAALTSSCSGEFWLLPLLWSTVDHERRRSTTPWTWSIAFSIQK
jgi:hypothetical protein